MGQTKTPKGEISVTNFQGRIRIRWRYAGERSSLNLPFAYSPENLHYGNLTATEIKLDIMKGCFDPSLEKYKPVLVPKFNEWCKNIRNVDNEKRRIHVESHWMNTKLLHS